TAGSPCGNVGHRQLFKFFLKAFPKLVSITTFGEAFFLVLPPPFYLQPFTFFQLYYYYYYYYYYSQYLVVFIYL
ncbi:hypothetical protein, partial [Aliarcobacter butzleri]|uniref:hypothetical protein n=1 Tax=Aliarcobacter butzleri TaxID=28197 RepID=UPI002B2539C9